MQNIRDVIPGSGPMNAFSKIPQADIQRSKFDLSRRHVTTQDAGYLYIVADCEVLPGDTYDLSVTGVIQALSLKHQLMDSLYMDLHWWFVPMRLTYENWELLQGQRPDPDSSIDKLVPIVTVPDAGFVQGSLADDLGWPIGIAAANFPIPVTSTCLRAYNLIYNTWYRDQNLIDSVPQLTGDGPDAMTNFVRVRRGKRKVDPFTSALPFAQKGAAPTINLGTTAPVTATLTATGISGTGDANGNMYNANAPGVITFVNYDGGSGGTLSAPSISGGSSGDIVLPQIPISNIASGLNVTNDAVTGTADLSAATAITVNALRQVVAIQHLLELYARGGTRYTETVHSLFGVTSPDARLQRPEFLGGTTIPIMVHSVVNQTSGTTPLGERAGFGHAQFDRQARALHSFTEHGTILCIASTRQDYTYGQGIRKRHTRRGLYDFYMPPLANLGEEPIYNWELLVDGTANDLLVGGYNERWYDYRIDYSYSTHLMRPTATGTLAAWHLQQTLAHTPGEGFLSQDFVEENPPMSRVEAVPSQPSFNCDFFFDIKATRPLPLYSVPGLKTL